MTSSLASPATRQQIVQITAVDPTSNSAVGQTRQGQQLTINTRYMVGAVHYTPGVGEQWYIQQVGTVNWALERKLPQSTNDLLNVADNPVPGQVQIGSSGVVSGPLNLMGSTINAQAPISLLSSSTAALPAASTAGQGAVVYNTTTNEIQVSDGTSWNPVGAGGGTTTPPSSIPWSDLTDIPTTFPSEWSEITNVPSTFPAEWTDITGVPNTFPTTWSSITNIPTTFPTAWTDITGIPATFPPTLPTGVPTPENYWCGDGTWKVPPTGGGGGGGGVDLTIGAVPTGSINGSNTVFTLAAFTLGTTMVYLNGVRQEHGIDYAETNDTTLTMTLAPQSHDTLAVDFVPVGGATGNLVIGEVPGGARNGSNTTFTTAQNFVTASTSVFLNGMREQVGVDYTESGNDEIIFASAPMSTDLVLIDYLTSA